jgi:glycosyltransferase involved in cell wall biosynthesis
MKILYLSEILGPHDYRLLEMNLSRGHDVTLVAYREGFNEDCPEEKYYDVRNLNGLKIINNHKLAKNTYLNFLRRIKEFRAILLKEKPDIVHAGWIQTSGLLAALSGFHPYLLMPWGSDIIYYSKNSFRNRLISRYAIHKADMITCDCEYQKRILVDDFKYPLQKVAVMPWDVDLRIFNKANNDPGLKKKLGLEGKKVILMMRNFRPEYAIEDFIKALPKVRKEYQDAKALIVGYGPLEERLKELSSRLNLDDFIYWAGYVPQGKVVKYINISDIYVSTSLRDGSSSSLLEAMSCGLPVVVSDIPGNLEWVEDEINGVVVKKSNPASIAAGINRLLKDERLCRLMSENNVRKVEEKADFCKNFLKLEEVYKKLFKIKKA